MEVQPSAIQGLSLFLQMHILATSTSEDEEQQDMSFYIGLDRYVVSS